MSHINKEKLGHYSPGIFFLYISFSILTSIILNYIFAYLYGSEYYSFVIWFIVFILYFLILKKYILKNIKKIIFKFKENKRWPKKIIILNSIVWSFPIIFGALIQTNFIYYVSGSIGLGNIITYLIFLKYNKLDNKEQLIVGVFVLSATLFIPLNSNFINSDFVMRIIIGIAYGVGGIYSVLKKV